MTYMRARLEANEEKLYRLRQERDNAGRVSERSCAKHMEKVMRQQEKVDVMRRNLAAEIAIRKIMKDRNAASGVYDLLMSLRDMPELKPSVRLHIACALQRLHRGED